MESSPQTIIKPKSMRESPIARPRALSRGSLVALLARNCAAPQRRGRFQSVSRQMRRYARMRVKWPANSVWFARSALAVRGPGRFSDAQGLDLQFAFGFEQVVPQHDPAVLLANTQQSVGRRHHSSGGARVPRPAPSSAVSPTVVNISGLLSGNKPVDGEVLRIRFFQRRDLFVNLEGARAEARRQFSVALAVRRGGKAHEPIHNPSRAVAVLTAVLTHPGRIVRDPSRVGLRMFIEWRFEQQHPVRALDPLQAALDRGKRAP